MKLENTHRMAIGAAAVLLTAFGPAAALAQSINGAKQTTEALGDPQAHTPPAEAERAEAKLFTGQFAAGAERQIVLVHRPGQPLARLQIQTTAAAKVLVVDPAGQPLLDFVAAPGAAAAYELKLPAEGPARVIICVLGQRPASIGMQVVTLGGAAVQGAQAKGSLLQDPPARKKPLVKVRAIARSTP